MGKRKITTTINPGVEITVDDAEYLDLTRQGLIKTENGKPYRAAAASDDEKKGE